MFEVTRINELTDGKVYVEWSAFADDGQPITEGDYLTPKTDNLEGEIEEWLIAKKKLRQKLNQTPPQKQAPPKVKRKTAQLDEEAKQGLRERVSQSRA